MNFYHVFSKFTSLRSRKHPIVYIKTCPRSRLSGKRSVKNGTEGEGEDEGEGESKDEDEDDDEGEGVHHG